jgi:DNA-directed RNA polymerase alpha subunit
MNKTEVVKTLINAEKQYALVDTLHRVFGKNIKIKIGFSNKACNAGIDDLVLSVRSYNALRRANIMTIGDLIERLNEGGLKTVRNLGAKSFREIQTQIMIYGFEQLSEKEKAAFFDYLVENNTAC